MEKPITNLVVRVDKAIWYKFKLILETKRIKVAQALEQALSEYNEKHKLDKYTGGM